MKTNWFNLQTILDLRASTLEKTRTILGQAQAKLAAAIDTCNEARRQADSIADGICSAAAILTAAEIHSARQWHLHQTQHAQAHHLQVQECQKDVRNCLVQVVNASREHEILARFREKSFHVAQALETQKAENLLNDQINSQRFQKGRQSQDEALAA